MPRTEPSRRVARVAVPVDRWVLASLGAASGPALVAEPVVTAVVMVAVVAWLGRAAVSAARRVPAAAPIGERCVASRSCGTAARPARPGEPPAGAKALLCALVLAALAASRVGAQLDQADAAVRRARDLLRATSLCEAHAVVVGSPVMRQRSASVGRGGSDGAPGVSGSGRFEARVELLAGHCDGREIRSSLQARLYDVPADLGRGDRIDIEARLGPVELLRNAELPDPRARIALDPVVASGASRVVALRSPGSGVRRRIDALRGWVRGRIERSYSPELAPYARALVLGETDLAEDDQQAFRRSGLAHLLAVSGTHLVVTVLGFCAALRALLARVAPLAARFDCGAVAAAAGAVLAPLYADFAGGSGSAKRAAAMLAVALLARALGRRPATSRCFAISLGGAALVEPLVLAEPSFMLSVGATVGLLLARQSVADALAPLGSVLRGLGAVVGCTLGATAGCTPVLLWWGVDLPLLGVAANLLAAPLGEAVALPCCLAHAALGWLPSAEHGAAVVASGALTVVRAVAQSAAAPSFAAVAAPRPTAEQVGASLVALLGLWRLLAHWRVAPDTRPRAMAACVLAALLVASTLGLLEREARQDGRPRGLLRVTVLDVGQGDALLVDMPDGSLLVIDAGSTRTRDMGQRVLEPALRLRRRAILERVVSTHAHEDHAGGLAGLLASHPVRELWLSDLGVARGHAAPSEVEGASRLQWMVDRLAASGVRVATASELCARPHWMGGAMVEVLSPCPASDPARDANHNSLVLRLRFGLRTVLLMADADAATEERLLRASRVLGPVDLLKVGHHGSRTSTSPELVSATAPKLAVLSCGARNRLGHPAPSVVERLARRGAVVWRTDQDGALRWQTDGIQTEVALPGQPLGRRVPLAPRSGAAP